MSKKPFFLKTVVGYTRFVLLGRGFLWLMIAGLILLMVIIANQNSDSAAGRLVFSGVQQMNEVQNMMQSPHYQGLDKDNMPFSVIADKATQLDDDTVRLDNIKADLATTDGKWLALHSGEGEIKIKSKFLTLTKQVDMFYDGGFEFRTERANVNIEEGSAKGIDPVQGQGPMGTLTADSFEISGRGKIIKFDGSVKVTLHRN